jgi:Zn-dependent protease
VADRIVLWPLGGYVVLGRTEGLEIMEDFWVALAGPLTHIPMAGLWFVGMVIVAGTTDVDLLQQYYVEDLSKPSVFLEVFFRDCVLLNAVLFLFNLFIPAYPLSGGRIWAALLVKCGVKVNTAAYVTSITALLLAAGMVVWGLYVFLLDDTDGGSPIFLFLIAAFIAINSFSLLTKARQGKALEHALFAKECYQRADNDTPADRKARREQQAQERPAAAAAAAVSSASSDVPTNNPPGQAEMVTQPPVVPEPPPMPVDPGLSPAGGGTSWTTMHNPFATSPSTAPAPAVSSPEKKKGLAGRLFGKKENKGDPTAPDADEHFV